MANAVIIDALFAIPRKPSVTQLADCIPFSQDLAPLMSTSGITGAILAPCDCSHCQHQWNCADRRTDEIVSAVAGTFLLRSAAHWRELTLDLGSLDQKRTGRCVCPGGVLCFRVARASDVSVVRTVRHAALTGGSRYFQP